MASTKAHAIVKTKDQLVQELFDVVRSKREEILKAEKPVYKTNLSFRFDENSSASVNLNVENDLKRLVQIYAFLIEKEANFNTAAKETEVDIQFMWCNFPADDWKADIKSKINKIQINQKKVELDILEKKLDKHISPEERDRLEFEALQKEINNL